LPYNFPRDRAADRPKRNIGGLVNALEPVLARCGGMWVGWDGITLQSQQAVQRAEADPRSLVTDTGVRLLGVPLGEREMQRYYHGFCNRTLWPLFHGLVDTTYFLPEYYGAYEDVNLRFARMFLEHAGSLDRVWVHDYHLLLVPRMLREHGFQGRIDFFLHIPFPPSEIFRALPWRRELLDGLLAADTVVFHVEPYRDNFAALTGELLDCSPAPVDSEGRVVVRHGGHCSVVAAAPIGIEVDEFETLSRRADVRAKAARLIEAHRGRKILFGADRLDYTKGILERFRAVERLLSTRPDMAEKFNLVQIVVPSRHQVQEYRELKQNVDREVGRINGEYARSGWIPLHYQVRGLNREDLVAHYVAAHAALVTPLKDGMNLVASEFVASRTDEQGALVLSEFAGVARSLDRALIVNPYDLDGCARAIHRALEMDPHEQRSRMIHMRKRVRANKVSHWAGCCLGLRAATDDALELEVGPMRARPSGAEA